MIVDKDFCLSSYMAFRYTFDNEHEYFEGMKHQNFIPISEDKKTLVKKAADIHQAIKKRIDNIYESHKSIGILLSGGMDSAIVASYLRPGAHAFTFSSNTGVFDADIQRAKNYCQKLGLIHHLVEIDFEDYKSFTPIVMKTKCGPVHSIEPQIYKASTLAKELGVEIILIGDGADYVFGGMNKLLACDWDFDSFVKRYISIDPALVLVSPKNVFAPFEKYRIDTNGIDFIGFMDDICTNESYSSYQNAFKSAGMEYCDPYEDLKMADPLDLDRVRNGEPKYLVRELYAMRYPDLPIPTKIPMPRPVDSIFKDWHGPTRPEFRNDIPMETLTGNQKWQLWCAKMFLDINEPLR